MFAVLADHTVAKFDNHATHDKDKQNQQQTTTFRPSRQQCIAKHNDNKLSDTTQVLNDSPYGFLSHFL